MKIEFKIQGLEGVLKTLQELPAEIVSKNGGPVKLALKKGALVIKDEVSKNLQTAINQDGEASTGLLEANVIASRGKAPATGKGERYLVRVKRKTYPGKKGAPTTLKSAQILEYGSSRQKARPYIRPAFEAKGKEAIDTVVTDLNDRIQRIVKRLHRKNKGRK